MARYHFVGIGGIGMSALARILLQRGMAVRGSDARESELLEELRREGAEVSVGHRAEWVLPESTIVYSTSIDPRNPELVKGKERMHRSDLLHLLMQGKKPLLVTGTHGKTTTTALLATLLLEGGLDPSYAVGGIVQSEGKNGHAGQGPYFVAESDESDGSFLRTPAFGAIITNVDGDHLDYWKSNQALHHAFEQFANAVEGPLFWCIDKGPSFPGISYGFSERAEWRITEFAQTARGIRFSVGPFRHLEVALLGKHNACNAAAAVGLAYKLGLSEEAIRRGLARFRGTVRRLEFKGEKRGVRVYDDYGHHPTEVAATLAALRAHVRERRLIVLFQPHRYTRTQNLWQEFTQAFSDADLVFCTDIYSAGEAPLEGITAERLAREMGALYVPRAQVVNTVAPLLRPHDVVLTLGAGDITAVSAELLSHEPQKLKVTLLSGGASPEHEISLRSVQWVQDNLSPDLYEVTAHTIPRSGRFDWGVLQGADVVLPILHGPFGEDGRVQALCDLMQVAVSGCDHTASAIAMHKGLTKRLAMAAGIDTARFLEFREVDWKRDRFGLQAHCERTLAYPLWVKAVHLGSSIGITRVTAGADFIQAVENALQVDTEFLVEEEIVGRQIEFSVLGNDDLLVGEAGEILAQGGFYSYDAKYGPNSMGTATPADLSPELAEKGKQLALDVYRAIGGQGFSRIDFFLTPEGHYLLNEVNPIPGMTSLSLYPKMLLASGLRPSEIVDSFVWLALHRRRQLDRFLT